ncbi:MAG: aminoglycoside 6-adenylyltransferase [Chloroflexi bacterium]|nr:aminoglycoside 6-adenylyltransferase [Chloroflexota bacterium]
MNYAEFERGFTAWAQAQADFRAAIVVGSRARIDPPPDEWSDLDLIVFTTDLEKYAADRGWLDRFGAVTIAVLEHSPRGDAEWLIVYDDGGKFDVLLAPVAGSGPIDTAPYDIVLVHGARALFDKSDPANRLNLNVSVTASLPSVAEFTEALNHTWLTALRAAKFIARGDLWRAKHACDSQLKAQVLTMLEWHTLAGDPQRRVWHDGRDIAQWADRLAVTALPGSFAAYNATDLRRALLATLDLYRWLSIETAQRSGFAFPTDTHQQVVQWLKSILPPCRTSHAPRSTHLEHSLLVSHVRD